MDLRLNGSMRQFGLLVPAAVAALLSLQACAAATVSGISCEPTSPEQLTAQSLKQAAVAEAILDGLRRGPRNPGQVIDIAPAAYGGDSARIEAALMRARQIRAETGKPVTLAFAPGRYQLSRPIALTAADSGTPEAPLRFEAASAGAVIIVGSVPLLARPLPAALDSLLAPAQRKAVAGFAVPPEALPALPFPRRIGVGLVYRRAPTLFVLQGDRPLWRASFPADGYAVQPVASPRPGPIVIPQISVPQGLAQVAREPALQAGGFWTFDWSYEENAVSLVHADKAPNSGPMVLAMPQLKTSYAQSPKMRYRLLNGFSFIQRPGQMAYADGALAAYPFSASAPVEAATLDHLVTVDGAHDVAFDGLAFQGARQDVMTISDSHDITVSNAFLGLAAGSAITIKRSNSIVVERSVIADLGDSGVVVDNDPKMPSGNMLIADNIITRTTQLTRAYRPAIELAGHDNVAMGNAISDLPQHAIKFAGTRNLIVGNEISKAVLETSDSGAITAFYDLSTVHNTVTQNYLHDIATSPFLTQADSARYVRDIYLDSWTSFTNITNNLTDTDATSYFLVSGSRNFVSDNIWFRSQGPSGEVYDSSHHRNDSLGHNIFDNPMTRQLAACSDLNVRYDPDFLRDGVPRNNRLTGNYNIGGLSAKMAPTISRLQQVTAEKMLPRVSIDRERGFPGLLDLARKAGAPIGHYLEAADRTAALRTLRYRSRSGLRAPSTENSVR